VPPQNYTQLLARGQTQGSFFQFWLSGDWIRFHGYLPIVDLAHVWFLPYLFFYSCLIVAMVIHWPKFLICLRNKIDSTSIATPLGISMLWYAFVQSIPPPAPNFAAIPLGDITAHLLHAPAFFFGFVIADSANFWKSLVETRRALIAAASLLLFVCLAALREVHIYPSPSALLVAGVTRGAYGGLMPFAIFAWAKSAFARPLRGVAYATDAILPIYLMHQTVLVVGAYQLGATRWPAFVAFPFLIVLSLGLPLVLYHLFIRRVGVLRFIFGIKPLDSSIREHPDQNVRP
jgi:glucans biosynthesis protein C